MGQALEGLLVVQTTILSEGISWETGMIKHDRIGRHEIEPFIYKGAVFGVYKHV